MGNYVYTMRKKRVRITDLHGDAQDAVLFSYAYKPSYSFAFNESQKGMTGRMDACADRAWDAFNGELVIVGDTEGGVTNLGGCSVYKDVTSAFWTDCNEFPGVLVGFVKVEGKKLRIVRETEWWTPTFPDDRDFRRVVKDGKTAEEMRYHDPTYQYWWSVAQKYNMHPTSCSSWRINGGTCLNGIDVEATSLDYSWLVTEGKNGKIVKQVGCSTLTEACELAASWKEAA
jgi:hypothetical protein